MIVSTIKTERVVAGGCSLFALLDKFLPEIKDGSVLAITSKIVSLCENRVLPIKSTDKEKLIEREADYYLPAHLSKYGYHFTIKDRSLASAAGIDESNGGHNYILWPKNPQKTANTVREYLREKFDLDELGIVITDSTCTALRWGTVGMALAYSGFKPVNNYIGSPDLFGRKFEISRAGVASGLAATAVLVMGEGTEQTPLVILEDLPFVQFQDKNPDQKELEDFYITNMKDDLFAPFLNAVKWEKGGKK